MRPTSLLMVALSALALQAGTGAAAFAADQQSRLCEPGSVDCTTDQGQMVQYSLSRFDVCSECHGTPGGEITAYLGDIVVHPPAPVAPNPAEAIAQGKLYSPDAQVIAIGRIYAPGPTRDLALFVGHAVPASASHLVPAAGTYFVGRRFARAALAISTVASGLAVNGWETYDTATLSAGFDPTGSITFDVYGPNDRACTATPAFSASVSVRGDGAYSSPTLRPTAANAYGTYAWVTTYSGDANNPSVHTTCGDPTETILFGALSSAGSHSSGGGGAGGGTN